MPVPIEWRDAAAAWMFTKFADVLVGGIGDAFGEQRLPRSQLREAVGVAQDYVLSHVSDPDAREALRMVLRENQYAFWDITPDPAVSVWEQIREGLVQSLEPLADETITTEGHSALDEMGVEPPLVLEVLPEAVLQAISNYAALSGSLHELASALEHSEIRMIMEDIRDCLRSVTSLHFCGGLATLRDHVGKPDYSEVADHIPGTSAQDIASSLAGRDSLPDWVTFCRPYIRYCLDRQQTVLEEQYDTGSLGTEDEWRSFWDESRAGRYSPSPIRKVNDDCTEIDTTAPATANSFETSRSLVLGDTGVLATLRGLYEPHKLVNLWGVDMPICVFPALDDEITNIEAPLGNLVNEILPEVDEFSPEFDPEARQAFDERLSRYYRLGKEGRQRFFSGPTYALRCIRTDEMGHRKLDCDVGRYFPAMATSEDLDAELMRALASDPKRTVSMEELQRRSWVHRNVQDPVTEGRHRSAAVSHATVVIVKRVDGRYNILLPTRSAAVHTHANFCHVAPSGIFSPYVEHRLSPPSEFSVRRNFYREWVEELYGAEEHARPEFLGPPDPTDEPEITRLLEGIEAGQLSLFYTGISVNLLTLRPEICLLLFVRETEWLAEEQIIAQRSGRRFNFGWEYNCAPWDADGRVSGQPGDCWFTLDPDLKPADGGLLRPSFLIPNAGAAIHLALHVLGEHSANAGFVEASERQPD